MEDMEERQWLAKRARQKHLIWNSLPEKAKTYGGGSISASSEKKYLAERWTENLLDWCNLSTCSLIWNKLSYLSAAPTPVNPMFLPYTYRVITTA